MSKSLHELFDLNRLERFPTTACENLTWTAEVTAVLREAHRNAGPDDAIHLVISPDRALFLSDILEASYQATMDNFFPSHQESHNETQESNVHRSGHGTSQSGRRRNHGEGT